MDLERLFRRIPVLETERLILRGMTVRDWKGVFLTYSDPEVGKYNRWHPVASREEAEDKIRTWSDQFWKGKRLRWGIVLKETNEIIGDVAYVAFDQRFRSAEIGFNLGRKHWRQGIMSEAVAAALKFGFEEAGFHRIMAHVLPQNEASRKLLEKFHFEEVGTLREVGFDQGEPYDILLYNLIRSEFHL